jgi:hypothetical protein
MLQHGDLMLKALHMFSIMTFLKMRKAIFTVLDVQAVLDKKVSP